MSKPDEGTVIEPSVSGDIGEVMLEEACKALVDAGTQPRLLQISLPDNFDGMGDLARKFGVSWMINAEFEDGEWSVHNFKEGEERVTFWNKPW